MCSNEEWVVKETEKGFSIYIKPQNGQQRYEPPQWHLVIRQVLQCNKIWDDQYRLAAKLFILQKELKWESVRLDVLSRVWQHHGLRREDNSMLLSPSTLRAVIEDVLFATSKDPSAIDSDIDVEVGAELTACFLWQLYDRERVGKMTLLNAKVVLAILSRARPQDVWQLLAHEASNHDGQVSERRLRAVLESLVELPCTLGEEAQLVAERLEVVELLLRNCFTQEWIKVKDQGSVERWFAESVNPVLCWLWNLARMRVSKQVVYPGACTVCKRRVLRGQVFRCDCCVWYWICQRCYIAGRCTLNHRLEHPVTDYITPVSVTKEKCYAMKRIVKTALCLNNPPGRHHYPSEPMCLTYVPPVVSSPPMSEPIWSLRKRLRDMVAQLEQEGRKLQSAADKWQTIQEAGPALAQHGQRLQMLGAQLSQLVGPVGILRPESTPLHPPHLGLMPHVGFVPRLLELSPIMAAKSEAKLEAKSRTVCEEVSTHGDSLELSTILHHHASVQVVTDNSTPRVTQPQPVAHVTTALDKLQALIASSSVLEESFSCHDNEQLKTAARELEEMLSGLITGMEKRHKTQVMY